MASEKKSNGEKLTRKDVHLSETVLGWLEKGASRDLRPLKNYMEKVLIDKAEAIKNTLTQKVIIK